MACHMLLYVKVKFCYEDYSSYEKKDDSSIIGENINMYQLPLDLKLSIRKVKHLKKIIANKSNFLSHVFHAVLIEEKDRAVEQWCTLGVGVRYPCVADAWSIYSERLYLFGVD
ncbi:uncharacterized protein LOC136084005 [Hydra vulgaris]|uniref:Uncharacterized protein LOC136084005 n=1 Tax=Hydra vulgaris TaxID=6087 RepID=A0ABM4CEG0_HYDVU